MPQPHSDTPARPVASIILMVLGGIGALLGVFAAAVFGARGRPPLGENAAAGYASFGVILLLFSLIYLFGGIGSIRGRRWGRVLGVIAGIIGVLLPAFVLLGSIGSLGSGTQGGDGLALPIVFFALHAFVLWALAVRWRNWGTRTA